MNSVINFSTNILQKKINLILSMLGFSEKYYAFEYLSVILTHLIVNKSESINCYNDAIEIVMKKNNLTKRSLTQSLNKLLNTCANNEITQKAQFNILNNGALNKIRVVKSYIENKL